MTKAAPVSVSAGDFFAQVAYEADAPRAVVVLRGVADWRVRATLDSLLHSIMADIGRLRLERVDLDFRALEFMNSSCFKSMVSWLSALQTRTVEPQCKVHFISKTGVPWQQRSLAALACVAVDRVTIEDRPL
jgi:hypothetical protein